MDKGEESEREREVDIFLSRDGRRVMLSGEVMKILEFFDLRRTNRRPAAHLALQSKPIWWYVFRID